MSTLSPHRSGRVRIWVSMDQYAEGYAGRYSFFDPDKNRQGLVLVLVIWEFGSTMTDGCIRR